LDKLLDSIKIERKDVYITNIVKDRPPKNRDPLPEEINSYSPFLDKEIDIIRPILIVCLGRFSSYYILKKFNLENEVKSMGAIRGKVYKYKSSFGDIKIIPIFHPASIIYDRKKEKILFLDFQKIKKILMNN
jgi:uracil-DNA glycosylase